MTSTINDELDATLKNAYAPRSQGPLSTAIRYFARFAAAIPDRFLFSQAKICSRSQGTDDSNQRTMLLFAQYLARQPSNLTGRLLKASSIQQRVELVSGLLSMKWNFGLVNTKNKQYKAYFNALNLENRNNRKYILLQPCK